MKHFLLTWLGTAVALLITAKIVPGIILSGFTAALIAAIVIGLVNAIIHSPYFADFSISYHLHHFRLIYICN